MSPPHEALGAHRGFARLDAATLQALASCLRPRTYARGDIIFRHGDPGDELFVVLEGALSVQLRGSDRRHREVASLGPGDVVGELACVDPAPRAATVLARTEVKVLALSRDTLGALLAHVPAAAQALLHELLRGLIARLDSTDDLLLAQLGPAAPTRSGVVPRADAPAIPQRRTA
jgi:CRP/FNR family transcriptional regulator, cyclic AMP receptor protein